MHDLDTPRPQYARPPSHGKASRQRRWPVVVLAVVAGVALVGVSVLMTQRYAAGDVAAGLRGYEVVSDSAVHITFDVRKPADTAVTCHVLAKAESHAEVGHAQVPVGPAAESMVTVTYVLETSARAVMGTVSHCVPR